MQSVNEAASAFLANKRVAVTGVSRTPKTHGSNNVYRRLRERGYDVLLLFGENTRYDLVIDTGHGFAGVQCKTGRLRLGGVTFKTCSSYAHHPHPKMPGKHYLGDVEYFAVYCPDNAAVYLVPINDLEPRWPAKLQSRAGS